MKYTDLLPFLDREELNKVVQEVMNGELKNVKLDALFPFLDRTTLNELVQHFIEKKDAKMLQRMLPFISRKSVELIYQSAEKGEIPNFEVEQCIPFLGSDQIKQIFRDLIQKESSETESDEDDQEDEEENE
ncbi:MAG: hypothetical protein A2Y45_08610 [Tenericutes bacterium GWC2_34_14]|nr:MAG: hypothetical protein A2Z84_01640 [Tenericutes bacterium GWA2_35_7]OHE29957.1 MAG: hypothetical protein A2Y45_08610 [Tenericutes bacterium GWC2_34_14]OHE34936.1 MAG: hypothetical protein A2012_02220 [Tenericutes bacterium GWE2_34_108]OHE37204.1 MAG: hypothetical protein A2Y46_00790 [Tenericutes bacterium GWF1_35_14]OHE39664.1 MAG: hypothetical protein A2Y44_02070 [Tenericutes bacterium GWF2_35_184]OHE44148.1 MAG: hypothetical protein A2221_03440 [Tenericutes bacterium RIFOXYA2_FULL_36_3